MNDISARRRRIGIAALTTPALALPLTASISYAAAEADDADEAPLVDRWEDTSADSQGDEQIWVDRDADPEEDEHVVTRTWIDENGERRVVRLRVNRQHEGAWTEDDQADLMAEIDQEMAELERELEDMDSETRRDVEQALAESRSALADARRSVVLQRGFADEMQCNGEDVVVERELADGRRAMMICRSGIGAAQVEGMRAAMEAIRNDRNIPADARRDALESLREAIEDVEEAQRELRNISFRVPPVPPQPPRPPRATQGVPPAPPQAPPPPRNPLKISFSGSHAPMIVRPASYVTSMNGEVFVTVESEVCEKEEQLRTEPVRVIASADTRVTVRAAL